MSTLHDNDVPQPEARVDAAQVAPLEAPAAEPARSAESAVFAEAASTEHALPVKPRLSSALARDVHKALFSSPSMFSGMYEDEDVLVRPAFPSFGDQRRGMSNLLPGPWRRGFFALAFRAAHRVAGPGDRVHLPDYGYIVSHFLVGLAVYFGKQFDSHGLVESHGHVQAPHMTNVEPNLLQNLGPYTDAPRVDAGVRLNFVEIEPVPRIFSENVAPGLFETFMTAGRLYLRALRSCHTDPESAYVDLVMCGEVLSQYREFDEEMLYDAQLKDALRRLEAIGAAASDLKLIKKRLFQVKNRYIATIRALLNDGFFTRTESKIERLRLQPGNIEKALGASYDLRSRYVHRGGSLHGFAMLSLNDNELPTGIPAVEDKELSKIFWRAPTFVGMERIVRFCLLRLLHTNGIYIHSDLD